MSKLKELMSKEVDDYFISAVGLSITKDLRNIIIQYAELRPITVDELNQLWSMGKNPVDKHRSMTLLFALHVENNRSLSVKDRSKVLEELYQKKLKCAPVEFVRDSDLTVIFIDDNKLFSKRKAIVTTHHHYFDPSDNASRNVSIRIGRLLRFADDHVWGYDRKFSSIDYDYDYNRESGKFVMKIKMW